MITIKSFAGRTLVLSGPEGDVTIEHSAGNVTPPELPGLYYKALWTSNLPDWGRWTGSQMKSYIDENVTDLASAKLVLKKLALAIAFLRNQIKGD